jgi:hypothetical protein
LNGVITGGPGLVAVGLAGSTYTGDAAVWTSPDGVTWSRVPHNEAVFSHQDGGVIRMNSVTRAGSRLVAVGDQNLCCSYNVAAAVWTSPDGVTWSRVPHDEAVFDGAGMSSVTAGGPGLVAVGFDSMDFLGEEHVIAVAWNSPDGITWSRVPHNEAVFDRAEMSSVTAGGPGLVAVGASYPHDDPIAAVVWTSADGVTWSRVPHNEAVFDRATMSSVTAGGPGLVAVGGESHSHDDPSAAVVWTSADGVTWSRVAHDEAVFGRATMSSVTAEGPGLVAVGRSDEGEHAVWTSPDGITWSRVAHDEAVFDRGGMHSVTAGDSGLVAVGFQVVDEENHVAAAWTSPDGITWSRVPHDEIVFGDLRYQDMFDVTAGGPGFIAVGSANRNDGDYADGVVWVAATGN